jgi:hypothetical protein
VRSFSVLVIIGLLLAAVIARQLGVVEIGLVLERLAFEPVVLRVLAMRGQHDTLSGFPYPIDQL